MPPRRYAPSYAAKKVKKMVKRNLKRKGLDALNPGKRFQAKLQRVRSRMDLAKRRKVKSIDLGPKLPVHGSMKVNMATEGYIVPPHYQSIGSKRRINKMVSFMYPSHKLVYRNAGLTAYVDNEQAVTLVRTNETIDLNDALTAIQSLVYDVQGPSLPGNVNLEVSGTTAADPTARIGGYLNKMYLETHYTKLTLTSNVELGQKVEVLPILVRNNTPVYSQNTANDATVKDPLIYWKQLIAQQAVPTISGNNPVTAQAVSVNRLGLRPYDREYKKDFERWFKCLTPAKFVL